MATITNKSGLVWLGENSDCKSLDVKNFADKIYAVYATTTGGVDYSDPLGAELGISFSTMSCGSAYLVYSVSEGIPYEFESAIESNLDIDSGRLDLTSVNLEERFVITNLYPDADGTYIMTTSFLNDKPIYRNQNDWYGMYNDDDTWSLKNKFTQHTLEYKNNDSNPSGGIYLETTGGNTGPVAPTPTPTPPPDPVSIGVNILGRWDAQFASNSTLIEDPINSNDISVQPSVIKDDLSPASRGKVFTMTQSAHYCKLGDILNETFNSENFSISLWCNPNTLKSLSQNSCCYLSSGGCVDSCVGSILASKWVSSPSSYKNSWLIYSSGTFVSDGSLKVGENAPGSPNSTGITKSIPYNSDTWTHLLYSVNAGFVTIYMNGEDVTNPDHANIKHSFDLDCSRPIILGNIQTNSGYPSSNYGYWGGIDDFRVYEGPLSANEVNAIYTKNDTESFRVPFDIPSVDSVETELPMSNGIQKLEINSLVSESEIYAMDIYNNQLVIAIATPQSVIRFKFYQINNDSSFTYIPEETSSVVILPDVIESPSDIKVLKFIRTTDQTRVLLVWTQSQGLIILSNAFSNSDWTTSVISVNMNSSVSKMEYVSYEDSAKDTILISDNGSLKSYRKDDFGFWEYAGFDSGVNNIAVSNKKLTICRPGTVNSNIFNLFVYDISNPDQIPGIKSHTSQLGNYSFQGSFDSENYALTMHGDDAYASFSGMKNNSFKFDPNDNFLPSASPSFICKLSDNLNFKENIFPPYRLSGIDYDHIHSFGYDIDVNDTYLVATNKLCDFACLYKKTTTGTWTFISRLVYGIVSSSPKCYLGSDYCIIECGDENSKKLVHFRITDTDLQPTDKTLQIVNANLAAWWDFSGEYGKLPGRNHIVFDKSGYNNHLGIGGLTYEQTSTAEIPSALNSDKVYRFEDSTSVICKSPIPTDTFSGEFTITVWIYRTEEHFPRRIVITKTNDIETNNLRTFALYSNGACDIDGVSLPAPLTTELPLNEWSFMTLVNETDEVKFYLNGKQIFSKPKPANSVSNFTTKELQVAPHGDIGYLDDIKIYKKALTQTEIQTEFDKSYRAQFLTIN